MKKSSIEWLEEMLVQECGLYKDSVMALFIINQAKELHKQELESTYNHAMWALMDTGHGDSFDEYYKNTYEKEN